MSRCLGCRSCGVDERRADNPPQNVASPPGDRGRYPVGPGHASVSGRTFAMLHPTMKFRDVVIFNGTQFKVPQGIQRIDTRATHGWQVRYGGTKLFSDHTPDGSGASPRRWNAPSRNWLCAHRQDAGAVAAAEACPARTRPATCRWASPGRSCAAARRLGVRSCSLSVLLPRYGQSPRCSSVYIGTENTYTVERYQAALAKARGHAPRAAEAAVRSWRRPRPSAPQPRP
jgi:hypothetical protein